MSELSQWCTNFVADMLECAPADIDPDAKFSRMGFDSAMSVQLAVALEQLLEIEIDPDVIADHPTISRLVIHLAARCAERPRPA